MTPKKFILSLVLTALSFGTALAQAGKVTGFVRSASDNTPIQGVLVTVEGTSRGTLTARDGGYTISAEPGETLVFSHLGYTSESVRVDNLATIDILLRESAERLDDIIVLGYGTVRKSDLTGSVTSVKASDVVISSAGSVDKLLQGRIAGLQVINPYEDNPEGSVTIRVRGLSSINASNTPLMVVDGIPMGEAGNLKSVNPNIIESIEVLKDASATAIYGSRGANGVIMITTKSGRGARQNIWFNGRVGVSAFSSKLDYWRDPLLMAELTNEAFRNANADEPYTGRRLGDGIYYPSLEEIGSGAWPYHTDWPEYIFRTAVTQDYNVGLEGSNGKNSYYVSIGYYGGRGTQHRDDYNKYSFDLSYSTQVHKNVRFITKSGVVRSVRTRNSGTSYARNPLWPIYNGDGSYFRANVNDFSNPVMMNNELKNESDGLFGYITARLEWNILPELVLAGTLNGHADLSRSRRYNPRDFSGSGREFNGQGINSESLNTNFSGDAYLTYSKVFGGKHNFSAMVGGSYEESLIRSSLIEGRDFDNDILKDEVLESAKTRLVQSDRVSTYLVSGFMRFNYSFSNKYLFTFTARADGSSKFGSDSKWGFFPSGAVSWKLEEEDFIKNLNFFDQLKLRVSYGTSGNQGISPYQTLERFGSDYYWMSGQEHVVHGVGMQIGREGNLNRYVIYGGMPNNSLGWERTAQLDLGLDLTIFKGRLGLTLDLYYKRTTDLLRQQILAPSTGFDRVWVNDGVVDNKGLEIAMSGAIVDKGPFRFNAEWIFSMNRNKVVSIGTAEDAGLIKDENGLMYVANGGGMYQSPFLNILAVGQPMNVFYGYEVNGMLQTEIGNATNPLTAPGEFNYNGLRPDGTFDPSKRTIIGNPHPKFISSLNLELTHKSGVDLSVMLYGVYGNDVFSQRKLNSPGLQAGRWTYDNPNNERPRLREQREIQASSWFVEDGSFLRVQYIMLGYTLPYGKVRNLDHLRVYVNISNPFTLSKVSEYDPETGENGIGNAPFPRIFTVTSGVEIKF